MGGKQTGTQPTAGPDGQRTTRPKKRPAHGPQHAAILARPDWLFCLVFSSYPFATSSTPRFFPPIGPSRAPNPFPSLDGGSRPARGPRPWPPAKSDTDTAEHYRIGTSFHQHYVPTRSVTYSVPGARSARQGDASAVCGCRSSVNPWRRLQVPRSLEGLFSHATSNSTEGPDALLIRAHS